MSKNVRNAVIGFAVAFVVGGVLGAVGGYNFGTMFLPIMLGLIVWYVLQMLANNKAEVQATPAERDAALATTPAPGTALIFVYRDGFIGKALGIDVLVNGQLIAQLKSPRFTAVTVNAGPHTINAGPKGFAATQARGGEVSFNAASGETLFFHLRMEMGALKNSVTVHREMVPDFVRAKLTKITMVSPARSGSAPAVPAS